MATSAELKAHHARSAIRRAAANPWLELLERVGYVARGILYVVMGGLALGLALGIGGKATDPAGSLATLAQGPIGRPFLIVAIAGLAAYSLWGFVRAIFDPWRRGSDAAGLAQRLGFMWSGFAYASIVLFALHLLAGNGPATGRDSTQAAVRTILTYPAGEVATVVIGLITIGVGIGQFAEAFANLFQRDFKREEMPEAAEKVAVWLGRFGMFSRGVTFALVGWFVLQAGLHRSPAGAHGYSGAFIFLLDQPYGHVFLAVVALGFIALGLHSFALARWARLLGSS